MRGYQTPANAAERERLILEHLPQVNLIARRLHDRLPASIGMNDLVSAGVLGLINAVDNFDASHNVQLKTYAEHRIRGAMLDSLRGLDWAPRDRRKRAKEIEAAIAAAEQRLHRVPADEEIAAELNTSVEEYRKSLADVQGLSLGSFELAGADGEPRDLLRLIPDSEENMPSVIFERSELQQLLARSIEKLPEQERLVLSLYYEQELNLREIAAILKVHLSRVGQIKTQAILRLRTYMTPRWTAPASPVRDTVQCQQV